ncbi:PRA1 family protein B4-like [Primulina huaijiensis]|uniref:PRA1 family protein B4-like n=1 Tax=Primulina huaijiensis TaxID=1492673 RepID=UPI003CC7632C
MANSSPSILHPATADTQQSTSAVRSFFSSISEKVRSGLSNHHPWSELVDRSAFSKPESLSDATIRIRRNYQYFRVNYIAIITIVLVVSLLTNPFSLIILSGLLAAWQFLYLLRQSSDPPIVFCGRQFSDRETFIFLIVSTVVVIFLTSVGSVMVSALIVGVAIVCLHGAFRDPEDLFLDEQEPNTSTTGFLSFFTGAKAAVTQYSPVAARV